MIYLQAAMLSVMIVIGGVCAYEDLKTNIVPNKLVFGGAIFGIIANIVGMVCFGTDFIKTWFINMLIADIFAFCMYLNQIWAAGDAKLFMMMFLLFPPFLLDGQTLVYCTVPFMFIFVPALMWVVIDSIVRACKHEKAKRQPLNIKSIAINWFLLSVNATALFSALEWLVPEFVLNNQLFCSSLILAYSLFCGSVHFMRKWWIVTIHACLILAVMLIDSSSVVLPSLLSYPLILLIIVFQRLVSVYNYQLIPTSTVRRGMVLAAQTVIQFRLSRVNNLPQNPSEDLRARISEDEAKAVRKWQSSAHGQGQIWIVRKVPFAIMIEIGFALWTMSRLVG